jgi:hypothetical protein
VRSGALVGLPRGTQASTLGLGAAAGAPRFLRPDALATLLYMAAAVQAIIRPAAGQPLEVTAATTPSAALRSTARAARGLARADPLDASGYAFDIARSYGTPAEAQALQFVLDRLNALNLIAWDREGPIIHVVVGSSAGRLDGLLKRLLPAASAAQR